MPKPDIKDLTREELIHWLAGNRVPAYRSDQIRLWLFRKGVASFAAMTNLSADLRRLLDQEFTIGRLHLVHRSRSGDGTQKLLFALDDGDRIESVLIPEAGRLTLCLSTQAGCALGCDFCATARMGLKRNLRSSEIVDQILEAGTLADPGRRITNLVFMGMGEPLANYEATRRSLQTITDSRSGVGISPRRITVSTVGLVPQIRRLAEDTTVNLAVSLHATTNEARSRLIPINRKYPLEELLACCRSLPLQRRKRITFEFLLLRGLNDSPQDARRLGHLLNGMRCKINLIPFNPHPGSPYARPAPSEVERFQSTLVSRGYQVNIRKSRGDDIQAACGQLWAGSADGRKERRAS